MKIGADEPEPIRVSWLFVELEIIAEPVIVWTPDTELFPFILVVPSIFKEPVTL